MNILNAKVNYLLALVLICILIISGCAIGRKINYSFNPELKIQGSGTVSITTLDQREAVIKENGRKLDFVGYCRSGVGIAYPMGTSSGKKLSDIITDAISTALTQNGYKVCPYFVDITSDKNQILNKQNLNQSYRLIIILINKWHTDTYSQTTLFYDIVVEIYNNGGNLLAKKGVRGEEILNSRGIKEERNPAPIALTEKVELLFNDITIRQSLSDETAK